MARLLAVDTDNTELGILLVPVAGDSVENQAEVPLLPRFDGSSRDRLDVDVWLASPDKAEGYGQPLSILPDIAMEAYLDGNCSEDAIACVRDLTVDIGHFRAGKAVRFAHL